MHDLQPVGGDAVDCLAQVRAAVPTLTTALLQQALHACEAPVESIEDLLRASSAGFFESIARSILANAPSTPLRESLPGLNALGDSAVPDGAYTARPHNILRRIRKGGSYTWGDIGSRSPNQLLTMTNLGMTSANEIVRVAARAAFGAFSPGSAAPHDGHAPQVTAAAALPSPIRRSLVMFAAWLEIATGAETLGEGLLLCHSRQDELPDDVASAWKSLSETPLIDVADAVMLDLPERLRQLDEALGDERSRTIFWARIRIDDPTLDSLATPLGLTRERVRQLHVKAEEAARAALLQPELAGLRWQAVSLRRALGVGFPESATWAAAALDEAARRGGEEWRDRLRVLLLWLAGPYRRNEDGWLVRGRIPNRATVMAAIDDAQRVDFDKVQAVLLDAGLAPAAVDEWLDRNLPVRLIGDDMFVWEGSVADKAYVLLNAWSRPASADELADAVGEGHALRSTRTRLLDDPRFKRVDRIRIGLQNWPHDEYTGIVDELAQELERRGGDSELRDLVMTVAHSYDLKVGSVEAYTAAPRFVIEGSRIRLRGVDEPYQPRRKLTDEARCYLVNEVECTYRMPVDREVLRGSGRPIPEGLGSWLGVLPRMRRDYVFGDDVVPVTWPDSSFMGPSIGSVRRTVVSLGGSDGDRLLLRFNREGSTGTAGLVTAEELAAKTPEARLSALTGIDVRGSVVDAVAGAIGASAASVKERLRKRGETDLLDIVSPASLHLEAALDRLRQVL